MNVKAALVIIAFKRPKTLNLVLESVSAALVPEYQRIIFVQQGKNEEVSSLIKSFNYLPSQYLNYERTEAKSPEQAINANVYRGVAAAFENRDINLVTVLEDDILIAKDFLKFNLEICKTHYLDPAFRGINGFSGIPRSTSNCVTYSKQRFGLGWGWSITDKTWKEMKEFWLGTENFHWDGLVESFCKCGFVIMPSQSRIINLGFSEDATHTSNSDETKEIESKLIDSFVGDLEDFSSFTEVSEKQNWRIDCLPYLCGNKFSNIVVQKIYEIQYILRIKPGNTKTLIKVKAKLLGFFQRAVNSLSLR